MLCACGFGCNVQCVSCTKKKNNKAFVPFPRFFFTPPGVSVFNYYTCRTLYELRYYAGPYSSVLGRRGILRTRYRPFVWGIFAKRVRTHRQRPANAILKSEKSDLDRFKACGGTKKPLKITSCDIRGAYCARAAPKRQHLYVLRWNVEFYVVSVSFRIDSR